MEQDRPSQEEQISRLFGGYKAEWLKEQLFELFTKPAYFPELETSRPCILMGGRGTGKTTVLRSLSYDGRFALTGYKTDEIKKFPYFGFYYRVNTNRVTAFKGPELEEEEWMKLFAHYFNLVLCELTIKFLTWYQLHTQITIDLNEDSLNKFAISLNINSNKRTPDVGELSPKSSFSHLRNGRNTTIREMSKWIAISRTKFEAYINNVIDGERPLLSMQGAPVDILLTAIQESHLFSNKNFFFLIDEYENFEPYQQQVVNTLIKHAGEIYTFKIGVRELGIRRKNTLNPNEQLISPADYVKINIAEKLENKSFSDFALKVCKERFSKIVSDQPVIQDACELLPRVGEDDEAIMLGVNKRVDSLKKEFKTFLNDSDFNELNKLSPLYIYFFGFWARNESTSLESVFRDYLKDKSHWDESYNNYKHALLFTLKSGKSGIQKFYCGWKTFTRLAANNIRYLLELVDQSLILHLQNGSDLSQPVSFETQTRAAQNIGKKNLSELEGLSVHGAQLTKLLLSLGRIFQVMASDAVGHAPEVNQFHLSDQHLEDDVEKLLSHAVMHLALLRSPGNKLVDETDTKQYDYMIHPIFSPFFVFSYRRKRKMTLNGNQILGLVRMPKATIREILDRSNRTDDLDTPLPEQMRLFEGYYHDSAS